MRLLRNGINRNYITHALQFPRIPHIPANRISAVLVCVRLRHAWVQTPIAMAEPIDCRSQLYLLWLVGLAILGINSHYHRSLFP